jgi:nickel/cobalt transporter (NicO) family protein
MTRRRLARLAVLVAAIAAALLVPASASGHPLGNFTVNRYARAEASGGALYVRYVVDMAEIPALRERSAVDAAGGLGPYAHRRARASAASLVLTVDGARLPLAPVSWTAAFHPGAAGLKTLRLAAWYRAPGAAGIPRRAHRVELRDTSFPGRIGWREVAVRASSGARAADATVPPGDRSDELRHYPRDLLSRPLDVAGASFTWTPGTGGGEVAKLSRDPESAVADSSPGGLAGLVDGDLSAGVILLALLAAIGWGALHALSPGHGKSMIAAYLIGSRGRARHAFLLGAFVTLTHTATVVLLGVLTLSASELILPETLFGWVNLAAGLMVVAIGGWVLWTRSAGVRARVAHRRAHTRGRAHHHHDHAHHHHHEHGHGHGEHGHSHAPPSDLSVRGLAAAGVSAGLLPCPSAMVLLLGSIALGRVGYGLVLVVAFSLGLAGVLTGIGLLFLYARRLMERLPLGGRLAAAVPVASAAVIVCLGVVLTARALPGVL